MTTKIHEDRPLTNTEKSRRFKDRLASIDEDMDEAFENINWERRNKAEKSLVDWVNTYFIGLLYEDAPSIHGEEVLRDMEQAITNHEMFCVSSGRGNGKSTMAKSCLLYAILVLGMSHVLIVSSTANGSSAIMNDLWRIICEPDTALLQDYPVLLPFHLCNFSFKRRQLYKGIPTQLTKTSKQIVFPRLKQDETSEVKSSQARISVSSMQSSCRGLRLNNGLLLLDDIQTDESGTSEEQVAKNREKIQKELLPLAGKQRLSVIMTATPISNICLVSTYIKESPEWKLKTIPSILSFPKKMEMWDEYFKVWNRECVEDIGHDESLQFYKNHREEMDEGSETFNPTRFSTSDGHISMIQKLLEMRNMMTANQFSCEYLCKPIKYSFTLDVTPQIVLSRMNTNEMLEVPNGFTHVFASSDLNLSESIHTVICAFRPDQTSQVIFHMVKPCNIDFKLNETEFNKRVYNLLAEHGRELKALGVKLDGWGIDANGNPFNAVLSFCQNSMALCRIPSVGCVGKANHLFNPFVRSRISDARNNTVLCSTDQNHNGKRWLYWSSCKFKEMTQRAFLSEVGSPGSCSLFKADIDHHLSLAQEVTNEKLQFIKHLPNGKDQYFFKVNGKNHFGDALAQCFAIAASNGISGTNFTSTSNRTSKVTKRKKYRFV